MNIVITMAGLGSRFRKAGYKVPKYMIEAHGKTCFEWSLISLAGLCDSASKYIFIVRKEDAAREFIARKCTDLGISHYEVIEIDFLTKGQAATAMLASRYWDKSGELLIYNIDTYVEPYRMNRIESAWDGFIPCFNVPGDHWSFVRTDAAGRAIEVREKTRISDNSTLGAYFFKSCELYENLYNEYYSLPEHMEKGEEYVAPLYNYLIQKGGTVYISTVDSDKVHVLGTPEELELFIDSYVPSKERCAWCGTDPLYMKYHDEEWGVPVHDDRKHFEFILLESAQAGLSWLTILRKRENYRAAYDAFDVIRIANYDEDKYNELLSNKGIVRNRLKIRASINNAKEFIRIQEEFGSFDKYIWGFTDNAPVVNNWESMSEIPAVTPLAVRVSADLKARGFKFLGPTIIYAHMQATGLVNDHVRSCFRHNCSGSGGI